MADIARKKSHKLEKAELRSRLDTLAEEMTRKFGIKCRWDGDTCSLSGGGLKNGNLSMGESEVSIEINLGLVARMLKGQIEKEIDQKMSEILEA